MKTLLESLSAAYVKVDVPSDHLTTNRTAVTAIQKLIEADGHLLTGPNLIAQLIRYRKQGKLPKLRNGHGPPKGQKQGHVS